MTDRLTDLPILFHGLNIHHLPDDKKIKIHQIDEQLPQTQCGLCGHMDGCLPYAYGIVMNGEATNLCVPGGQITTDIISHIMNVPAPTATPSKWETDPATHRPHAVRAVIIEDDCIGCTKCIPACPVDAIIGTAKHMHTIITDLCTGCELCLPPCPVDCITLVKHPHAPDDATRQKEQAHLRHRYHQHLNRVAKNITDGTKPVVNAVESAITNVITSDTTPIDQSFAKNTIELAKIRTQIKKLTKQLAVRDNPQLRTELTALQEKLQQLDVLRDSP